MNNPLYNALDNHSVQTIDTGLRGLSDDDEKRLCGISTISVLTMLALEFLIEEVGVFFFNTMQSLIFYCRLRG